MTCLRKNRVPDRLTLVVNCFQSVSLTYCAIFDERSNATSSRYVTALQLGIRTHINDNHNENDNYDGKAAYTYTHDNRAVMLAFPDFVRAFLIDSD